MASQIPYIFEATFYQPLERISKEENIGQTRIRAFYQGENRNGSFITASVAENLIKTSARKPAIGFYNYEKETFEGHTIPQLAKAYGYIPDENHFAWEKHLDVDGVEREYACFDVILFVDYWDEAKQIINKSLSMELNEKTIQGDWNDQGLFEYSFAEMKGFCILGDHVEPCFEGASFFSKEKAGFEEFALLLNDLIQKVEQEKGGEQDMINVPCAKQECYSALFDLVNPNHEEEEKIIDNIVIDINEDNLTVYSCAENIFKVYTYSKNEEGAFILSEDFEVVRDFEALQNEMAEKQTNFEQQKADFEAQIAELTSAKEAQATEFEQIKADLEQKIADFEAADAAREEARKEELVKEYAKVLSEEEVAAIQAESANFSYEELEGKLAVQFSRNAFKNNGSREHVPNSKQHEPTAFETLMSKYKKQH